MIGLFRVARRVWCVPVLCAFPALVGCVGQGPIADTRRECPYMGGTDRDSGRKFDPETAPRPSPKPILKFLELTGEGELRDRCQWADLLTEIRANSTEGRSTSKTIVIYVHGWKHDASKGDNDVEHFRETIDRLTQQAENDQRQVVGVFIGWPGSSTKLPIADQFTFWGRKRAADRVSQAGNVTKLLGAINNVRHQRGNPQDFIVAIGHSFGARILFTAASQMMLYDLQMKHPGNRFSEYGMVQGPVDLLVLLNPAFEASVYTALDATRRWQEAFQPNQQPVLLTVSTSNDWATKTAFPIGQLLGLSWHERQRTTVGNYAPYITHSLVSSHDSPREVEEDTSVSWHDRFCIGGLCLNRTEDLQRGNPFIVATTDKHVLDGHNDIWGNAFQSWLRAFVGEVEHRRVER